MSKIIRTECWDLSKEEGDVFPVTRTHEKNNYNIKVTIGSRGYFVAWQEPFKYCLESSKQQPEKFLVIARDKDAEDAIVFESLLFEEAERFSDAANQVLESITRNHKSFVSVRQLAACLRDGQPLPVPAPGNTPFTTKEDKS